MKRNALNGRTAATLSVFSLLLGACAGESGPDAQAADAGTTHAQNVRVLEVQRTDLIETVPLSGRLDAGRATDVSTEESGVVRALPVRKGEVTRAGQVIVALDRSVLDAERNSAAAAVTLRAYNEERTRTLFEANSVSNQEMLLAHTEHEQAKEAARIAQLRYERAAVKAPFEGLVSDHYVEIGQLVSPGTRVARVVDPYELELVGSLTEREIHDVRVGAPAQVRVEGVPRVIDAVVTFVGIEANPLNGKFPVELTVDNDDLLLRAGVIGRARVVKRVHRDVLAIPRDAVVRSTEGDAVFVVENDRIRAQQVRLGVSHGVMVVVEDGLRAGERIVVRGQRLLQPDSRVVVQEIATARDGSIDSDPAEVRESGNLDGLLERVEDESAKLQPARTGGDR